MHQRYTTSIGTPVFEEGSDDELGTLSGILLHPDLGKVEGFFVRTPGWFKAEEQFLAASDILHWGIALRVRSADAIAPIEEHIRLVKLLEERRPLLGQRVVMETGVVLGWCKDVQFETKTFALEWIFPKRLLRWCDPLPASAIIEVRTDMIVVRDTLRPVEEKSLLTKLDSLAETPVARPLDA